MTLFLPRLTDLSDERQLEAMNNMLRGLGTMSFQLSFLDSDGGTANGRKPYNFDAIWVAYTSNGSADTEDTVAHSLGRVPAGMLVGLGDKTGTVYDSGTAWTVDNIFLKADVASLTVNLLVF